MHNPLAKFQIKKVLAGVISFLLLVILILPFVSYAQEMGPKTEANSGLVPCGNSTQPACNFSFAILMINNIIDWIIKIAGVIFTISAIWGGFLYITSGENPGNREKAKNVLWSTLKGFVIILLSWLIIYTILKTLVPDKNNSIFKFIGTGNQ